MSLPYNAQFEIESGCTHRCRHCYNGQFSALRPSNPTTEKVIDTISKENLFEITLTGGEPLLSRSIFEYAFKKFRRENMDVLLNSNLHLLDKDYVKLFEDYELNCVLTSVLGPNPKIHDSLTRNKGSFLKLMDSLDLLVSRKIKTATNMVVQKSNKDYVYETGKKLIEERGIRAFCATPIVPSKENHLEEILTNEEYLGVLENLTRLSDDYGIYVDVLNPTLPCQLNSLEERRKYARFLKDRSCGGGRSTLTFSRNGDVRSCSHSQDVYGNILENSLEEITPQMESWTKRKLTPTECDPCAYVKHCKGGCRVSASSKDGNPKSKHPYMTEPILEYEDGIFDDSHELENFESLSVPKGVPRVRSEGKDQYVIYIDSKSNGIVDNFGLNIFHRFMTGDDYPTLIKEISPKHREHLQKVIKFMTKKRLLVEQLI